MEKEKKRKITRRDFIKLSAAAGLIPGSLINLAHAADSSTNLSKGPVPVIKKYPDIAKSKVIHAHHAGIWKGDNLEPGAVRAVLDASITKLVGSKNTIDAWKALFKPNERIAIKVNAFKNSKIWTHTPLVNAVTESLIEAGISAEQITIYDILSVFKDAGYKINKNGPGVRCLNETDFNGGYTIGGRSVQLSKTLETCDALINMPVLKSHMITGITFALKNHFGSVPNPGSLHFRIDQSISELNALPPIKDRTRLIIGDILEANLDFGNNWPYWKPDYKGDSILMSFDPVAHDTVGLDILEGLKTKNGAGTASNLKKIAHSYLKKSAELGLGTYQIEKIALAEIKLG